MTPEQFRRLEALYEAAAGMEANERRRFIDERCADDPEVHRELLAALRDGSSGLTNVVAQAAAAVTEECAGLHGRGIGRYRNLERIGRGAVGTVYRAVDPVIGRTVAIKVLLFDDTELRARFQQE